MEPEAGCTVNDQVDPPKNIKKSEMAAETGETCQLQVALALLRGGPGWQREFERPWSSGPPRECIGTCVQSWNMSDDHDVTCLNASAICLGEPSQTVRHSREPPGSKRVNRAGTPRQRHGFSRRPWFAAIARGLVVEENAKRSHRIPEDRPVTGIMFALYIYIYMCVCVCDCICICTVCTCIYQKIDNILPFSHATPIHARQMPNERVARVHLNRGPGVSEGFGQPGLRGVPDRGCHVALLQLQWSSLLESHHVTSIEQPLVEQSNILLYTIATIAMDMSQAPSLI